MEVVSKVDISNYAHRNTSPKMPIEEQYVKAFLDALMNSTSIQDLYQILQDEMQNGDSFIIFNSFYSSARNLNKEPYRSIIAYSMLKKDIRLFELISASMFTGTVTEYHGTDLYLDVAKTTDESPEKYTDNGLYTDMSEGIIQIGFRNFYVDKVAEDGGGSEYQTIEELQDTLADFDYIITLTKPARVEIVLLFNPYCYLSGDETNVYSCNIDRNDPEFKSPFGNPTSINILKNLADVELMEMYSQVMLSDDRTVEYTRTVTFGEGFCLMSYDFRISSYIEQGQEIVWPHILINSSISSKTFIESAYYRSTEVYYEKYIPIMLRINDNDPDGPCLALKIENDVPTIGAMFYTRDKKGE